MRSLSEALLEGEISTICENPKHQITNNFKAQNPKEGGGSKFGEFKFWYCLEFVISDLGFTTGRKV
jgi:hypothetical protein